MTKQEFIEYLSKHLTYEDIKIANAEAEAYAKGFKEALEAKLKQGEWIYHEPPSNRIISLYSCSKCGHIEEGKTRYCPNCGAKMNK